MVVLIVLNLLFGKKGGILIPHANVNRATETLEENFSFQVIWSAHLDQNYK